MLDALTLLMLPLLQVAAPAAGEPTRIAGDSIRLGNGIVRSWVEVDDVGAPTAIGVTLPDEAIESAPPDGAMLSLAFPAVDGLPFRHVLFDWCTGCTKARPSCTAAPSIRRSSTARSARGPYSWSRCSRAASSGRDRISRRPYPSPARSRKVAITSCATSSAASRASTPAASAWRSSAGEMRRERRTPHALRPVRRAAAVRRNHCATAPHHVRSIACRSRAYRGSVRSGPSSCGKK